MTPNEKIDKLEKKVEILSWFVAYVSGERLTKLVKAIEDGMVDQGKGISSWLLSKDIPDYNKANDKAEREFERLRGYLVSLQDVKSL